MLNRLPIAEVIDTAMKKYAEDNGGRIGISKKDVIRAVSGYGGDSSTVIMIMLEAMNKLASGKQILIEK